MRRITLLFLSATLLAAGSAAWIFRDRIAPPLQASTPAVAPTPDLEQYETLKGDLERWREELGTRYRNARSEQEKQAVLAESRHLLEAALPAMMRCWLGTPWDFNGTAKAPGQGKIACGYFVTTVLQDAGFQVERVQLAQQASETILRSLLPREPLTRRVGVDYAVFSQEFLQQKPGIYIVGLDSHVGFLVADKEGFRFLHSSGQSPWCVVDESREDAGTLRHSRYRVYGSLTGSDALLVQWLKQQPIPTRSAS